MIYPRIFSWVFYYPLLFPTITYYPLSLSTIHYRSLLFPTIYGSVAHSRINNMADNIESLIESLEEAQTQSGNTTLSKSWFLGFDTETTGADTKNDCIVSATLVLRNPILGHAGDVIATWLVNPHHPMNPQASAVNGFSDEYLQENGGEPVEEIELLAKAVSIAQSKNIPLLAYNAPFDVSMLRHDIKRWDLEPLENREKSSINNGDILVVDPLVIDRALSWRKGKRTLTATTQFYGVEPIGNFHDATADTVAAVDLMQPLCKTYDIVANMTLDKLMDYERAEYAKWAKSFNLWLQSKGGKPTSESWL